MANRYEDLLAPRHADDFRTLALRDATNVADPRYAMANAQQPQADLFPTDWEARAREMVFGRQALDALTAAQGAFTAPLMNVGGSMRSAADLAGGGMNVLDQTLGRGMGAMNGALRWGAESFMEDPDARPQWHRDPRTGGWVQVQPNRAQIEDLPSYVNRGQESRQTLEGMADDFTKGASPFLNSLARGVGFAADMVEPGPGEVVSGAAAIPAMFSVTRLMRDPEMRVVRDAAERFGMLPRLQAALEDQRAQGNIGRFNLIRSEDKWLDQPDKYGNPTSKPLVMGGQVISKPYGLELSPPQLSGFMTERLAAEGATPILDLSTQQARSELGDRLAASIEEDFELIREVFPKGTNFYHTSATDLKDKVPNIGREIAMKYPHAGMMLQTDHGRDLLVAITVPFSAGNNPHEELLSGIEMTAHALELYGNGRSAKGVMEKMKYKPHSRNPMLDTGTGWGPYSQNVVDQIEGILEFADQMPDSDPMVRLQMTVDWLNSEHDLQDIAQFARTKELQTYMTSPRTGERIRKRTTAKGALPYVPQALNNGKLMGWHALGAKIGPYAMSKLGKSYAIGVGDTHAFRDPYIHALNPFSKKNVDFAAGDKKSKTKAANALRATPQGREDREALQDAFEKAARRLGVDVATVQANRWYAKKLFDEFMGINTPGGTSTSALDEMLARVEATHDPSKILEVGPRGGKKFVNAHDRYEIGAANARDTYHGTKKSKGVVTYKRDKYTREQWEYIAQQLGFDNLQDALAYDFSINNKRSKMRGAR